MFFLHGITCHPLNVYSYDRQLKWYIVAGYNLVMTAEVTTNHAQLTLMINIKNCPKPSDKEIIIFIILKRTRIINVFPIISFPVSIILSFLE
jgi:hypothetical protein